MKLATVKLTSCRTPQGAQLHGTPLHSSDPESLARPIPSKASDLDWRKQGDSSANLTLASQPRLQGPASGHPPGLILSASQAIPFERESFRLHELPCAILRKGHESIGPDLQTLLLMSHTKRNEMNGSKRGSAALSIPNLNSPLCAFFEDSLARSQSDPPNRTQTNMIPQEL